MLIFLFLLLMLTVSKSVSETGNVAINFLKLSDPTLIHVSLAKYSISNPRGESIESFYTIPPNSHLRIFVTDIPLNVHFVVVQVHSYLANVTLSYDKKILLNNSVTGTNVGLLKLHKKEDLNFYLLYNDPDSEAEIMVATQAYGIHTPIPGGCNMEFHVEISPYLKTHFHDEIIRVDFAPAAPPSSNSLLPPSEVCNVKPTPVKHEMYYQYFPERDFTKETYFLVLQSMMTKHRILKHGVPTSEKLFLSSMRRIFASYPGTGVAFVALSSYMNYTSVYVPSFTYACHDIEEYKTCLVLPSVFSKVFCAALFFVGLFTCMLGHYFFKIEMFLFGYFFSGLITYIISVALSDSPFSFAFAVAVGLFVAGNTLLGWSICDVPIVSLVLTTLTLGFLLACTIFYPLVDFVDLFVLDINYWGVFIGIILTCPFVMLSLAEKANMIACSFLGSYVVILSVDHYFGSNLRFIFMNVLRRATEEKFKYAITGPPFQWRDVALCVCWFFLTSLGIVFQQQLMRNKAPYPPPRDANERTPLLENLENLGNLDGSSTRMRTFVSTTVTFCMDKINSKFNPYFRKAFG